jgi:hypothetical protein
MPESPEWSRLEITVTWTRPFKGLCSMFAGVFGIQVVASELIECSLLSDCRRAGS